MRFILFCVAFFFATVLVAQPISQDSVNKILKATPAFSIYKDNYLITGVPLDQGITNESSDIKYQISLQQRVTSAVLPFRTYLSFVYTQLAFWDIYASSSPFAELNFNPGMSLSRLFFRDKKLVGTGAFLVEHQSNGKSGDESRSWNDVALQYSFAASKRLKVVTKAWIPFSYKDDNPDLISYIGYGECKLTYILKQEKLMVDLWLRKGTSFDWRGSVQMQLYYKPFRTDNQYLVLQWYEGFAENLLHYNESTSMLRLGIIVKSFNFGFY